MTKQNVDPKGLTRRRFVWSAAAGGLVAASTPLFSKRAASAGKVKIGYISIHNPQSFWAKFFFELQKQAKAHSDGDLMIEWAGGPETMPPLQAPDAISKGVFDMCLSTFGFYGNAIPEGVGLQIEVASAKALRQSGALEYMDSIHRKKLGVTIIGLPSSGAGYGVFTAKPIRHLSDFKGLKIRSLGLQVAMLKKLGCSTVAIRPSETYAALERGVVEGLTWPVVGAIEFRYHEVAPNLLQPNYYHSMVDHMVNAKRFDGLPKDIQKAFLDASEATDAWGLALTQKTAVTEREAMKKQGLVENHLPADEGKEFLDIAVNAGWDKVIKDAPDTGPKLRDLMIKAAAMS